MKSSAGNGNTTGTDTGSLVIDTLGEYRLGDHCGESNNSTMTLGMNSSGLWNIIATDSLIPAAMIQPMPEIR